MSSTLLVRNLKKIYPGEPPHTAVNGISFQLKEAEILGLLGSNGAGKTTTIQMLLSTLTPTSGTILYFGKELSLHRSEILKHVVFASTYISLPWLLTARQNLEVFGRLYGVPKKELSLRIKELMERFGILSKINSPISQLSAGQITRLMLVKAFMVKPKVVLLDEPTASLDPDIAQDVCQFVLEQRETHGISILYTSHNMHEVSQVCDRVLFLDKGNIIADGHPDHLARSVSSSRIQLQVGNDVTHIENIAKKLNMPFKSSLSTIELGIEEPEIPHLLSELARAGIVYTSIRIIQPTLEDYFLHHTKKRNQ